MTEVIPAIIAKNFEDLKQKISLFREYSNIIQIDMCDGIFVESQSWPMQAKDQESLSSILEEQEGMPFWTEVDFEFDMMIINAHKKFDTFLKLGVKRMVFHLEAEDEDSFYDFLESLDPFVRDNLEIGISIKTTTSTDKIDRFINMIDFVQLMGIEKLGFQGQDFDERVLTQIKELKQKYPDLVISIDGSVNETSAPLLTENGATRLVIGSALSSSYNVRESINFFESL